MYLYLVVQLRVRVEFFKQFVSCHIKGGNDFLWVSHQLGVKVRVVAMKMVTTDIQERLLDGMDLAGAQDTKGYREKQLQDTKGYGEKQLQL